MKKIILIIALIFVSFTTFAGEKNNGDESKTVRYKGVFYEVVYSGTNYTVLINKKTNERKIVNYSK